MATHGNDGIPLRRLLLGYFFILSFFMSGLCAEEVDYSQWIAKGAPESYIVKNGDTLWEIAGVFLKDPWRWKQVWIANPYIDDPDRIYPGDKLMLRYNNEKPQLHLERGQSWQTVDKKTGIVKLRPRIRAYPAENPIPTIALHVIEPFLNQSRVVNDNQANRSPVVVALDDGHIVVGAGDRLFVTGLSPRVKDEVYAIFRPGKVYRHPKTKEKLGIEGLVLGKVEREVPGEVSRMLILKSYSEIKVGDRLLGTLEEEVQPYFTPKVPEGSAKGYIISVFEGISEFGQYQIVVLTGGCDKDREVGDVLAIKQTQVDIPSRLLFQKNKKYPFPLTTVGNCMVFRVFDKVSYALVMDSIRPINLLDEVTSP